MNNNNLPIYGCYVCGYAGTDFTKLSELRTGIGNLVCPNCKRTAADPIGTILFSTNKEIRDLREKIQKLEEELTDLRHTVKRSAYIGGL